MFSIFKKALGKVSSSIEQAIAKIQGKPTPQQLQDLEEALWGADLGPQATQSIIEQLADTSMEGQSIAKHLQTKLLEILKGAQPPLVLGESHPACFLIVGVNGAGKTTSVAKLAHFFKAQGKKVLIASADTFRPAANDQLKIWAQRAGVELIESRTTADPAAVAYDALTAAKSRHCDILLIDTAGRLTTKETLMAELGKIERALKKIDPLAPTHRWLVLDGSLGLNSLSQAQAFTQAVALTGLIITKLDGSPKGGFLVPVYQQLKIPVYFIGVGESIDALLPFDLKAYIEALVN